MAAAIAAGSEMSASRAMAWPPPDVMRLTVFSAFSMV